MKRCQGIDSVIIGACRLVVAFAAGAQAEINYLHDYHYHLIQDYPENSDVVSEQRC